MAIYITEIDVKASLTDRGFEYVRNSDGSIQCAGEGSFGRANLITSQTSGSLFIAKELTLPKMNKKDQTSAETEVRLLKSLDHPFIIKFTDCFLNSQNVLFIIMEYADGGDLSKRIKAQKALPANQQAFSEARIMTWFTQLCFALDYLHSRKILHRDLKAMNVFLTASDVVKLGDFGFSKRIPNSNCFAHTVCGTPYYFSPELCQGLAYSNKSDVWSLGVILYELATLNKPYNATNLRELMKKIVYGQYAPLPPSVPADIAHLVNVILVRNDIARLSVSKILQLPYMKTFTADAEAMMATITAERQAIESKLKVPAAAAATTTTAGSISQSNDLVVSGVPVLTVNTATTAAATTAAASNVTATVTATVPAKQEEEAECEYSLIFEEYISESESDEEDSSVQLDFATSVGDKSESRKLRSLREKLVDAIGEGKVNAACQAIRNVSLVVSATGEAADQNDDTSEVAMYPVLKDILTNPEIYLHAASLTSLVMSELKHSLHHQ